MSVIDKRLLDCDGEAEITENFNRVLKLTQQVYGLVGQVAGRIIDIDIPLNDAKYITCEWKVDNDDTVYTTTCDLEAGTWKNCNKGGVSGIVKSNVFVDKGIFIDDNGLYGLFLMDEAVGTPQIKVTVF